MSERLNICFIGCGSFVRCFIPLFKAHPVVESVSVCDLLKDRADAHAAKFGAKKVFYNFEDVLKDKDINAVAIFTQRHLHAPLVKQALRAGKHVYSAVPTATTVEDIQEIDLEQL